jgi:hypothetical protein
MDATAPEEGNQAMAADRARKVEAMEWCNALAGDVNSPSLNSTLLSIQGQEALVQVLTHSKPPTPAMKKLMTLPDLPYRKMETE